jgi:hypothetical protein
VFGTVAAISLLGAAAGVGGPPAGAAACYTGTWTLQDASLTRTIKTPYGTLTAAPLPGGSVTLTIGAGGTWRADVDKSFHATGSGPLGSASGTVAIDAAANGTYRVKKNSALVFRISAASGTATFSGTVNGAPTHYSYRVVKSDVQRYLGVKGKAVPACTAGHHLTLRFKTVTLSF